MPLAEAKVALGGCDGNALAMLRLTPRSPLGKARRRQHQHRLVVGWFPYGDVLPLYRLAGLSLSLGGIARRVGRDYQRLGIRYRTHTERSGSLRTRCEPLGDT